MQHRQELPADGVQRRVQRRVQVLSLTIRMGMVGIVLVEWVDACTPQAGLALRKRGLQSSHGAMKVTVTITVPMVPTTLPSTIGSMAVFAQ